MKGLPVSKYAYPLWLWLVTVVGGPIVSNLYSSLLSIFDSQMTAETGIPFIWGVIHFMVRYMIEQSALPFAVIITLYALITWKARNTYLLKGSMIVLGTSGIYISFYVVSGFKAFALAHIFFGSFLLFALLLTPRASYRE